MENMTELYKYHWFIRVLLARSALNKNFINFIKGTLKVHRMMIKALKYFDYTFRLIFLFVHLTKFMKESNSWSRMDTGTKDYAHENQLVPLSKELKGNIEEYQAWSINTFSVATKTNHQQKQVKCIID